MTSPPRSRTWAVISLLLLASSAAAAGPLDFSKRLSEYEGRWVVVPAQGAKDQLVFGFVYVDPQAGFTLDVGGKVAIGADGKYVRLPDANAQKARIMVRIDARRNVPAAPLPKEAIQQLGLEEVPEIVEWYADRSDPITHRVLWGRHLNHVGDARRALGYLEPAYAERPDAPGLAFELAYAYNELQRLDDAIRVLKGAVERHPDDLLLGGELAYASLNAGKLQAAIELYLKLIPRCGPQQMVQKSEWAYNLSSAYERLGDAAAAKKWLENARAWAPEGSPLHDHLNR